MRLRISSRVYDAEVTEFIWSYNSLEWCSKNVCKYFFIIYILPSSILYILRIKCFMNEIVSFFLFTISFLLLFSFIVQWSCMSCELIEKMLRKIIWS